jgi:hypothetical protein
VAAFNLRLGVLTVYRLPLMKVVGVFGRFRAPLHLKGIYRDAAFYQLNIFNKALSARLFPIPDKMLATLLHPYPGFIGYYEIELEI